MCIRDRLFVGDEMGVVELPETVRASFVAQRRRKLRCFLLLPLPPTLLLLLSLARGEPGSFCGRVERRGHVQEGAAAHGGRGRNCVESRGVDRNRESGQKLQKMSSLQRH